MPRTLAAILRHGDYEQPDEVPSAFLPHPLTETGRGQALACATELRNWAQDHGLRIHRIVATSRMLRAWETGRIIADALGNDFAVEETESLAERSVGAAANLTMTDIAQIIERDPRCEALPDGWKSMPDFRLPLQGAESLREAGRRVARYLEQTMNNLVHETPDDTLKIFVGHGASFRYAAVKLGVLPDEQAPKLSMFHCVPVYLERHADGNWTQAGGEWRVRKTTKAAMD